MAELPKDEMKALMDTLSDEFDQMCLDPSLLRPAEFSFTTEAILEGAVYTANNARMVYIHMRLSEELTRRKAAESEAGANPS